MKVWRRFRADHHRHERLQDDAATKRFVLEHELSERAKRKEVNLPPGRTNTDWTYLPPP